MNPRIRVEEMFGADLQKLVRDIEEFKNFQRSGQDSVRMYRIFSEDAVDKALSNVQFNNRKFRLTFTPEQGDKTSLVYKMEYTETQDPDAFAQIYSERENVDDDSAEQTWLFIVSGSDFFPSDFVNLKFFFWASGRGTFSITDL